MTRQCKLIDKCVIIAGHFGGLEGVGALISPVCVSGSRKIIYFWLKASGADVTIVRTAIYTWQMFAQVSMCPLSKYRKSLDYKADLDICVLKETGLSSMSVPKPQAENQLLHTIIPAFPDSFLSWEIFNG